VECQDSFDGVLQVDIARARLVDATTALLRRGGDRDNERVPNPVAFAG
jgi:hypothetical protein